MAEPQPLTLDQLRQQEAYLALTEKQQTLVEIFIRTGSRLESVLAAYSCKSREQARVMSYTIFSNPAIIAALAVARGEDPEKAKFLAELERAITKPKSQARLTALRLLAQIRGYIPSAAEPVKDEPKADEPQKFGIGDLVEQDGVQYRIEAVPVITQKKKGFLED